MKKVILLAAFISLLSCERDSNGESYTLKGTLRESCDDEKGKANVRLSLYHAKTIMPGGGNSGPEYIADAYTDENGHFEISYEEDVKANIYLRLYPSGNQSTRTLLMGIPKNKNVDVGDVYYSNSRTTLELKVQSQETFSEVDTLFLGGALVQYINGKPEFRTFVGPFYNGQVLAVIPDFEGTVQVYDKEGLEVMARNVDTDLLWSYAYFFRYDKDRGNYFYTEPCGVTELNIVLDSLETK